MLKVGDQCRQLSIAYSFGLASTSIGNNIYVIGGQSADSTLSTTEKYDTKTDTWTTELSLPTPRLGFRAVAVNNIIRLWRTRSITCPDKFICRNISCGQLDQL